VSPKSAPLTVVFLMPLYCVFAGKIEVKNGMFAVVDLLKAAFCGQNNRGSHSHCILVFNLFFADPLPPSTSALNFLYTE
jgi:hypothetical protein